MASRNAIISSVKSIPGAQAPSAANQGLQPGMSTARMSPLSMELETGSSNWGSAYRNYLPRPAEDFTQGAFGPFSPILPVPVDAPPEGSDLPDPRLFQYEVGWNLPTGQPGSEGIKLADFNTLRTLADTYSVARACIQLRKSEIRSLEWDIMPTKEASKAMRGDRDAMRDFGERRAEMIRFFKRPDPDYFSWNTFIDALLEEVFVFDALSLLVRHKWAKGMGRGVCGSDLDSLNLISGPTIRPLLDLHGARPRPPAPAYQQYLYGVPRSDLMTLITERDLEGISGSEFNKFRSDQLIYLPMVPRRWTPYGFPPIERALIPVMAGLQKQGYQLDYFREGTVPAVYISPGGVNANMTPNQLRELQDALNAIAGDPAWKHKIIVLPADSRVEPQRSPQLADQFDEIVMNQVCMGFDVMPMELGIAPKVSTTQSPGAANQMAKMTSGIGDRKATKPTLMYIADIMDSIIQGTCNQGDMRFMFEGMQEQEDEATKTTMIIGQVGAGLRSIDEGREELNLQPWGLPETSDPGWATVAGGFVPLPEAALARQTHAAQGALLALPPGAKVPPAALPPGAPAAPGTPPQGGTGSPAAPQQSPGHEAAEGTDSQRETPPAAAPAKPAAKPATPAATAPAAAKPKKKGKKNKSASKHDPAEHQARREGKVLLTADEVTQHLAKLVADFRDGKESIAQVLDLAVAVLARGYHIVMTEATNDARADHDLSAMKMDGDEERSYTYVELDAEAVAMAEVQRQYLMTMLMAVATGAKDVMSGLTSRLKLYGASLTGAYNRAYGRTMAAAPGHYEIIWHIGASRNCHLCIDRDGKSYTEDTLPGFPGDGGFGAQCYGGPNCNCSLEYIQDGVSTAVATNTQRDQGEVGYYQQQLADITARRTEAEQARQEFLSGIPEGARARAQNRDDIRREMADAANARIRATGGYGGVSVEPRDIPASQVADQVLLGSPKYRAVASEMESLARQSAKGKDVTGWKPKHITVFERNSIIDLVSNGVDYKVAASAVMSARRVVDENGQEYWVVGDPDQPWAGPAGGGGPELTPHDANGIQGKSWSPKPGLNTTDQAIDVMLDDYPVASLNWMRHAQWHGPMYVATKDVDRDDDHSWAAHHEHKKVNHFKDKIDAGETLKPVILIKKPGNPKLVVIDGHHRTLAALKAHAPVFAFVGYVDTDDGPWDETHSFQRTEGAPGASEYAYQKSETTPVAAGAVIESFLTGRVLMLQRALDGDDPAAGFWEFPGGCLEEGEDPEAAAKREWSEETGLAFPDDAVRTGAWTSSNGVYQGFTYLIMDESDLPIFGDRDQATNPDDPDGDNIEALAWWHLSQLVDNPAVRPELAKDLDKLIGIIGD